MQLHRYSLVLLPLVLNAVACKESEPTPGTETLAAVRTEPAATSPATTDTEEPAAESAEPAAEARPAVTQPAIDDIPPDTVLARLGDVDTVTQGDFEQAAAGFPPQSYSTVFDRLLSDRLFLLYLKDRPHLAPDEEVEKLTEKSRRRGQTREQWLEEIKRRGWTPELVRDRNRITLGLSALKRDADLRIDSKEFRQQLFNDQPQAFNGTEVFIRCIAVPIPRNATPQEREAQRKKAEDIRQRLLAGQIDWKKALEESDNPSHAAANGELGWKSRYGIDEAIAGPAFEMTSGELSPVVEARGAFVIVQARERHEGNRSVDDRHTIHDMKFWYEQKTVNDAYQEALKKYPVERVRPPARTSLMVSREMVPAAGQAVDGMTGGASTRPGSGTLR